jgi:hypothetical protein
MAHHSLGHEDEAKEWLAHAVRRQGEVMGYWGMRQTFDLLRPEAERMIVVPAMPMAK